MMATAVAAQTQVDANKRLRLSRREGKNKSSSHNDNSDNRSSSSSITQVDANKRPSRREGGLVCANEGALGLTEAQASIHEQGVGIREGGYPQECQHEQGGR